jgi:hypothetical protein
VCSLALLETVGGVLLRFVQNWCIVSSLLYSTLPLMPTLWKKLYDSRYSQRVSHFISHIFNFTSNVQQLLLTVLTITTVRVTYDVILKIMCQSLLCNKVSRGVEHTSAWMSLLVRLILLSNFQFLIYYISYWMTQLLPVYSIKINQYFIISASTLQHFELAVSCDKWKVEY